MSDGPTAAEREHVERALAETGAGRQALLDAFTSRDGLALAAMLNEAAMAYTSALVPLGPTAEAIRAAQPLRLRYDTLQWMFDNLVRIGLNRGS